MLSIMLNLEFMSYHAVFEPQLVPELTVASALQLGLKHIELMLFQSLQVQASCNSWHHHLDCMRRQFGT